MTANRRLPKGVALLVSCLALAGAALAKPAPRGGANDETTQQACACQDGPAQAGSTQQGPTEQPDSEQSLPPIEQRRHMSRRFQVGKAGSSFKLDTRYGRVQINAWGKQEIKWKPTWWLGLKLPLRRRRY